MILETEITMVYKGTGYSKKDEKFKIDAEVQIGESLIEILIPIYSCTRYYGIKYFAQYDIFKEEVIYEGKRYSPSGAARQITNNSVNGNTWWHVGCKEGYGRLEDLRSVYHDLKVQIYLEPNIVEEMRNRK